MNLLPGYDRAFIEETKLIEIVNVAGTKLGLYKVH